MLPSRRTSDFSCFKGSLKSSSYWVWDKRSGAALNHLDLSGGDKLVKLRPAKPVGFTELVHSPIDGPIAVGFVFN